MTHSSLGNFDSSTGILIVGHGSRNPVALEEFESLVNSLNASFKDVPVEYGYLEFAKPVISTALERLKKKSVKKVIAIPTMLFAAGHAKNDIPSLLNSLAKEIGLEIIYGKELGINSSMITAAGQRIKESIKHLPVHPLSKTLLVVVGRGSSDPDANSNVYKITRLLVEGLGLGWGETVYSGVTFPLVETGLRHAVKLGFHRIIVFPYFLFSGVLVSRIRKQTQIVANENPGIEFVNAKYLGNHPLVVKTLIERVTEAPCGENLMNCSLCKYRSPLLGFEKEVGSPQVSHHHHVEGIETCTLCDDFCTSECETLLEMKHHHDHAKIEYPHHDHPLGPVTLRSSNYRQI